jgi:hypothetical protein
VIEALVYDVLVAPVQHRLNRWTEVVLGVSAIGAMTDYWTTPLPPGVRCTQMDLL